MVLNCNTIKFWDISITHHIIYTITTITVNLNIDICNFILQIYSSDWGNSQEKLFPSHLWDRCPAGSTSAVNSMTKLKKIQEKCQINDNSTKNKSLSFYHLTHKIIIPAITAVMQWKTRRCCQQIAELLDMSRNDRTTEVSQHSSLITSSHNHCIIIIIITIIILKLEETRPACSTKLQSMGHKQNLCAHQTLLQSLCQYTH